MNKILFKTIFLLFIFIFILNPISSVFANSITILAAEDDISEYYLKFNWHNSGTWVFPYARYTYYLKDGIEYPAYCINEELPGAYENGSYDVSADEVIKDNKLWRVLLKGYGFRTPQEMGLDTKYQAYLATRFAVYCILYDYEVDDRYRANDAVGEKIITAMKEMVDYGRNGTDIYCSPSATIKKSGNTYVETINGIKYISQKYNISASVPFSSFSIKISNFPDDTKIFNSNNLEISESNQNNFKISIPLLNIPTKISGNIIIENLKLKSYPVLFGLAPNSEWQNYALVTDSYEINDIQTSLDLNFSGSIKIIKYSNDYNSNLDLPANSPLENAEFTVSKDDGTVIGTYTTNSDGIILIENLPFGTYTITETSAPKHFLPDLEPKVVTISENDKCYEVIFKDLSDNPKVGNIKILKYSDGYSSVLNLPDNSPLAGAVFTLSDPDGTVIGTYTTNSDGTILIENLPLGTYTITEIVAPEHFLPNLEPQTITISENGACYEVIFKNVADNPPLPKTGF